ncbi:hypothetical protein [Algoriphagus boritolerans]|uniref:hypothetical protein n=1 Tax=Algoriphagus boritolerans TaxID=308111 RepID=UPI002FCE23B9
MAFQNSPANASADPENPEKIQLDLWDGARGKTFTTRITLNPEPSKVILQVRNASGEKNPLGDRCYWRSASFGYGNHSG